MRKLIGLKKFNRKLKWMGPWGRKDQEGRETTIPTPPLIIEMRVKNTTQELARYSTTQVLPFFFLLSTPGAPASTTPAVLDGSPSHPSSPVAELQHARATALHWPGNHAWRIETCLWRCVHDWRLRRGTCQPTSKRFTR